MKSLVRFTFVFLLLVISTAIKAELPSNKVLTLQAAKQIGAAAEAEAKKRSATVIIAIVDDGGHLLLLERLHDTQVASSEVAIGKARTAASFRRPSKVFEDQIREGRVAALALPGATPLQGGIPLVHEGAALGAIGVSGNTPQEDEAIAKVGADSLSQTIAGTPARITYSRGVAMLYQEKPFTLYLPQLSDEAAFALVQLLYELARPLEQHHSTQIARYLKSVSQRLAESEPQSPV